MNKRFLEIIDLFPATRKAFGYVLRNSTSNEAPYHNLYHVMTVTTSCYEAVKWYGLDNHILEEMLLAGLFHDFSHSMGKFKDDVNIKTAIDGFEAWVKDDSIECSKAEVINIIKATQYPYVIEDKELSMQQKIIRDADLTQCLQSNWVQQIIFGLSKEMNISVKECIKGTKIFWNQINPNTSWFKEIWGKNKEHLFQELSLLENII